MKTVLAIVAICLLFLQAVTIWACAAAGKDDRDE